jgi:hypothetical protein
MKYYRILDPKDLSPGEENNSVYIAWKNIFNICVGKKIEEDLDFLYCMLMNIPALDNIGGLVEKTVLLATPVNREEFEECTIQLSLSDDLSICYSV